MCKGLLGIGGFVHYAVCDSHNIPGPGIEGGPVVVHWSKRHMRFKLRVAPFRDFLRDGGWDIVYIVPAATGPGLTAYHPDELVARALITTELSRWKYSLKSNTCEHCTLEVQMRHCLTLASWLILSLSDGFFDYTQCSDGTFVP